MSIEPDEIEPDQIEPDQKDWTWVLQRPCPECGFDAASLAPEQISPLIRSNAREWLSIAAEPAPVLTRRVRPDRWSPLEYTCHVRDVFRLYDERLQLMLTADNPTYPNWDQDRTAVEEAYNDQDPTVVGSELEGAAEVLAVRFDSVEGDSWQRRGRRSDGADFTIETFGRYMIHDPIHHLFDVRTDLGT